VRSTRCRGEYPQVPAARSPPPPSFAKAESTPGRQQSEQLRMPEGVGRNYYHRHFANRRTRKPYLGMGNTSPADPTAKGDRYRIARLEDSVADEFYRRNPTLGSTFNTPALLQTLANSFGREVIHLGLELDGSLEAVASLLVQRIGPFGNAQSLPIRYTGLESTSPRNIPSQILALRQWLGSSRRRIGRAHYSFRPEVEFDIRDLHVAGISTKGTFFGSGTDKTPPLPSELRTWVTSPML
jgi:hypothetical protein